ncbi:hypothetical protein ES705_24626 [subsurface metagenome]
MNIVKDILILNGFFNNIYEFIPQSFKTFLENYNIFKLNRLINSLKEKYGNSVDIRIINATDTIFDINNSVEFNSFSKLRINIERNDFLRIKNEISLNTRNVMIQLFHNLKKLKTFNLQGLFIPKLLEFELKNYFNTIFGQLELLSYLIQKGNYHKIILFNCNTQVLKNFKNILSSHSNLVQSYDNLLYKSETYLRLLNIGCYIIILLGSFLKNRIYKKKRNRKILSEKIEDSLLFIVKSKNQFNSVKTVYNRLKYKKNQNAIYYYIEYFVSFRDLGKLFRFLFEKRKIIIDSKKEILANLQYKSKELDFVMKMFYNSHFFIKLILLFNFFNNFNNFIDNKIPSLAIIANDFNSAERIAAGYFKQKKIPTLYIPHSAIPIIPELITKSDIEYYALGGESDKNYYVRRGIPEKNIINTGIPRYQNLYEGKIKELDSIRDMFDGKSYNFQKKDITILLTTNPIDDESNEKIINSVIKALMELNLVNNLIIKLHPSESGNLHKKITQKLNVNPVIVKDYNILELIKSSDLLISQKSTTLLEAMIIGTPMILLDFINKGFEESSKYEFLNEKFINTVKNQDSLTQEIKKIIEYKNKKEILSQKYIEYSKKFSFYDPGEPPTEKIVNFILKITKNRKSSN